MPRKQVDQLDEPINDQVKSLQLTDNERKILSLLKERDQVNDQVNTGYIAQQLNLSYSTVKRVLRSLKQRDMIYRVGSDKSGYWRIKEKDVYMKYKEMTVAIFATVVKNRNFRLFSTSPLILLHRAVFHEEFALGGDANAEYT